VTEPSAATEPGPDEGDGQPLRVSTLELFFDLVFVFAITQLTGILAALVIVAGIVKGPAGYVLWVVALAAPVLSPLVIKPRGRFEIQPSHFTERHGALVIQARAEDRHPAVPAGRGGGRAGRRRGGGRAERGGRDGAAGRHRGGGAGARAQESAR
jgi:low temperature requirement protein LtrA